MEGLNGQLKVPGKEWAEIYALETKLGVCSW